MARKRKWVRVTAPDGMVIGVMTLSDFCKHAGIKYGLAWQFYELGLPALGYTLTPAEEPKTLPAEEPESPVMSLSEAERNATARWSPLNIWRRRTKETKEEPKIMEEGKVLVFEEVPVEEAEQEEKREEINMTLHDLVCRLAAPCEISVRRDVGLPDAWEEVFSAPWPSSVWKVQEIADWQVKSFAPSKELGGLDVYVR